MGWSSKLSPTVILGYTIHCRKNFFLLIIVIAHTAAGIDDLKAQEVWFPWLEHVPEIQSRWTKTQDEAFSIWNNVTRFQDFGLYEKEIGKIVVLINKMEEQKDIDGRRYSTKYPVFFKFSDNYIDAMKSAVTQLQYVLLKLKEKSKNTKVYSWAQYQEDLSRYNQLLTSYRAIGQKMNEEFGRIQSAN